jgi:hypothetical protein
MSSRSFAKKPGSSTRRQNVPLEKRRTASTWPIAQQLDELEELRQEAWLFDAPTKRSAGKEADSKHLAQQLDELEEFRQETWLFDAAAKRTAGKEADSKHLAQQPDELEDFRQKSPFFRALEVASAQNATQKLLCFARDQRLNEWALRIITN